MCRIRKILNVVLEKKPLTNEGPKKLVFDDKYISIAGENDEVVGKKEIFLGFLPTHED